MPELVIADGAPGLEKALCNDPGRGRRAAQSLRPQTAAEMPRCCRPLEEAGDRLFTFTRFSPSHWKSIRTNAIELLHD